MSTIIPEPRDRTPITSHGTNEVRTITGGAIACPYWCIQHDDAERPITEAALAGYDEVAEGCFVHHSADVTVSDFNVAVSTCTDWAGRELEPPYVFVNGRELSLENSRELADAILAAVDRVERT